MRVYALSGAAAVVLATCLVRGDDYCDEQADSNGEVLDCLENKVDCETAVSWIGDGYCDDGTFDIDLRCEQFANDGGDCDDCADCDGTDCWGYRFLLGDGVCHSGGTFNFNCSAFEYESGDCIDCLDCDGSVVTCSDTTNYVGDDQCDDGGYFGNFNCERFRYDGGDCSSCKDCNANDCSGYSYWLGDDYCDDDSDGIDFNCAAFNFDEGDCQECVDCNNQTFYCVEELDSVGDGFCHNGNDTFYNFLCDEHNYDGGDCEPCEDCVGNDCGDYQSWLGDGICDDGQWDIDYNCEAYNYDDGDCSACIDCDGKEVRCEDTDSILSGYFGPTCDALNVYAEMNLNCSEYSYENGHCLDVTCTDCAGQDCTGFESYEGDGWCDNDAFWTATSLDFFCEKFNYDGGDCVDEPLDCVGHATHGWANFTLGDGLCHDGFEPVTYNLGYYGSILDFNCSEYNYDEGDCLLPQCEDCQGDDCTAYTSWLGDGICDDGLFGSDFDCAAFNYDEGDCAVCLDCNDDEALCQTIESYIGDAFCDDGSFGVDLVCLEFNYDGGDCETTTSSSSSSSSSTTTEAGITDEGVGASSSSSSTTAEAGITDEGAGEVDEPALTTTSTTTRNSGDANIGTASDATTATLCAGLFVVAGLALLG